MGWDDESLNAQFLVKIAEYAGIKIITIHGPTRCKVYQGKAHWKFIENLKEIVDRSSRNIICIMKDSQGQNYHK